MAPGNSNKTTIKIPFSKSHKPYDELHWDIADGRAFPRMRGTSSRDIGMCISQSAGAIQYHDLSQGVLVFPQDPMASDDRSHIIFKVEVSLEQNYMPLLMPKLKARNAIFDLNFEAELEPNITVDGKPTTNNQAGQAAMQMMNQLAGANLPGAFAADNVKNAIKPRARGICRIEVEFPHPYIWHPLYPIGHLRENDKPTISDPGYTLSIPPERNGYQLDTLSDKGSLLAAELRKFNPDSRKFRVTNEVMEFKTTDIAYSGLLDEQCPPAQKPHLAYRMRSRRAVLGKPDIEILCFINMCRDPEKAKYPESPAQDDEVSLPVFCKFSPNATLALKLTRPGPDSEIQTLYDGTTTVDGERVSLKFKIPNLSTKEDVTLDWKISAADPRIMKENSGFKLKGKEKLRFTGQQTWEITFDLAADPGPITESSPIELMVQIPLHIQKLTIQLSKTGWYIPDPITLSSADIRYTDLFKALEQGGAILTFRIAHRLKEWFEGLQVPDDIFHPDKVIFTDLNGPVTSTSTCDSQGLISCQLGNSANGKYSLDITDAVKAMEIHSSVLSPILELQDAAIASINRLETFVPESKQNIEKGIKDIRREYLRDYIVMPGTSETTGIDSIESTKDARKYAILSLSLLLDACADTPSLYEKSRHHYAVSFRSAVSCVFSALIDCILFVISTIPSIRNIRKYKKLAAAQTAAEESAEAATRGASEGTGELAEDLSKMSPSKLKTELSDLDTQTELLEKTVKELKEGALGIDDEIKTLQEAIDNAPRLIEEKTLLKEQAERELAEISEAIPKSQRAETLLKNAQEKVAQTSQELKALLQQKEDGLRLIKKNPADIALRRQIDKAGQKIPKAQEACSVALEEQGKRMGEMDILKPSSVLEAEETLTKKIIEEHESAKKSLKVLLKRHQDELLNKTKEATANATKVQTKEEAIATLEAKRTQTQQAIKEYKDNAQNSGIIPPAVGESIKFINDDKHWLRQFLYGIPGPGTFLYIYDNYEEFFRAATKALSWIMDSIGSYLGTFDNDVKAFSKRFEKELGNCNIKVKVIAIYGPEESWVKECPKPGDEYLNLTKRTEIKAKAEEGKEKKIEANLKELKKQVQSNILLSLSMGFEAACTYKRSPFTKQSYALGKRQVIGGENTLRRLISEETDSQSRADTWYGWNPLTVGLTTWTDYIRIIDWLRWFFAWVARIIGVLVAFAFIPTVYGSALAAGGAFVIADVIDVLGNSIRALIAICRDSLSKSIYLQLAINYPWLAQAWIFKGMTAFSSNDIEEIDSVWGMDDFRPQEQSSNITAQLDSLKTAAENNK